MRDELSWDAILSDRHDNQLRGKANVYCGVNDDEECRVGDALGGFLIGMGFGVCTRTILRFLQRYGATDEQQIALTLALGYLVFYTANAPCKVSGRQSLLSCSGSQYHCHPFPVP